jgi:hypothetical protein
VGGGEYTTSGRPGDVDVDVVFDSVDRELRARGVADGQPSGMMAWSLTVADPPAPPAWAF